MADSRLKLDDLSNPVWRLHNLYWIVDENGNKVRFVPNDEQRHFLEHYWYLNVILKARQLGFTTLIDLMLLDQCIFVPNYSAGIIAHNLDDAGKIFRNKVRAPWLALPDALKEANPLDKEAAAELVWKNGASIGVSTSMRSGTINGLHISEYGKIARKFPDKAREIRLGSFNAVHAGNFIFVESTAEGRGGDFYEIVEESKKLRDAKRPLTKMDFKLHFYPWWQKKEYSLNDEVIVGAELREYFVDLKRRGIELSDGQRAWYAKKVIAMKRHDDMKQEFPSFEEEAFEAANEDKFYAEQMAQARKEGRICKVPYQTGVPVDTWWDMGRGDGTAVILTQQVALQDRVLKAHQRNGQTLSYFAKYLRDQPYVYGTHYLPHDAGHVRMGKDEKSSQSWQQMLEELMPGQNFVIVPRVEDVYLGIQTTRDLFPTLWFDEVECAGLIKALENYRKEWDERQEVFRNFPVKDWTTEYADALRQMGQARGENVTGGVGYNFKRTKQITLRRM